METQVLAELWFDICTESPSSRKPEKGHETGAPETVNQTVSPPQSICTSETDVFTCRINKPTARQNS